MLPPDQKDHVEFCTETDDSLSPTSAGWLQTKCNLPTGDVPNKVYRSVLQNNEIYGAFFIHKGYDLYRTQPNTILFEVMIPDTL